MVTLFEKRKPRVLKQALMASVALVMFIVSTVCFAGPALISASPSQQIRTVSYNIIDDQSFLEDFDEHTLHQDESGIELVAKKSFDRSIFDEFDLVGLDDEEETFTVRYEINYIADETTMILSVIMELDDELPIIETMPGLIAYNAAGEPDVMFVVEDERLWLSDMYRAGIFDEVGLFSALTKAVTSAVKVVTGPIIELIQPAVKIIKDVNLFINAAKGALFLDMYMDSNGIYHAKGDCWQQYFGYRDLYDIIFDLTTSMDRKKVPFDVNNDGVDDYVLWGWKGDYMNLGAGAELGIYKRWSQNNNLWVVDRSLAITMTLELKHKGKTIIDWRPTAKQWWITGFDYTCQGVKETDLKATFEVDFSGSNTVGLYNYFVNSSEFKKASNGWTKSTVYPKATLSF